MKCLQTGCNNDAEITEKFGALDVRTCKDGHRTAEYKEEPTIEAQALKEAV